MSEQSITINGFKSGFYDSIFDSVSQDYDRKYSAEDFNSNFNSLFRDGVIKDKTKAINNVPLQVSVDIPSSLVLEFTFFEGSAILNNHIINIYSPTTVRYVLDESFAYEETHTFVAGLLEDSVERDFYPFIYCGGLNEAYTYPEILSELSTKYNVIDYEKPQYSSAKPHIIPLYITIIKQTGTTAETIIEEDFDYCVDKVYIDNDENEHKPTPYASFSNVIDVKSGGTGIFNVPINNILLGNGTGPMRTREIDSILLNTDHIPTSKAVKDYVDDHSFKKLVYGTFPRDTSSTSEYWPTDGWCIVKGSDDNYYAQLTLSKLLPSISCNCRLTIFNVHGSISFFIFANNTYIRCWVVSTASGDGNLITKTTYSEEEGNWTRIAASGAPSIGVTSGLINHDIHIPYVHSFPLGGDGTPNRDVQIRLPLDTASDKTYTYYTHYYCEFFKI